MSVEASGWAFRQAIPAKPKMVLMALADQADERTGHVCYGKTDMAHIARKASVPERSLYRYIAALVLNGYLLRESGKGRGHANTYWVQMDHPAVALEDWKWVVDGSQNDEIEADGEPQDVVRKDANLAPFNEPETAPESLPHNGRPGMPYVADPKDSTTVKNISKQVADQGRQGSFSKQAQDLARGVETPDEPEPPLCSFGLRSPEAAALQLAYVIVGKEHFCESVKTTGGRIYHHGEVSAQLLTLKDAPPRRDWPILTHRQAGAWNSLLGPLMPKMWRRLAAGSRAPWPWPPDQAGKIYPNSTGPPDTLMTDEDERDLKMLKA